MASRVRSATEVPERAPLRTTGDGAGRDADVLRDVAQRRPAGVCPHRPFLHRSHYSMDKRLSETFVPKIF